MDPTLSKGVQCRVVGLSNLYLIFAAGLGMLTARFAALTFAFLYPPPADAGHCAHLRSLAAGLGFEPR